MAVTKNPLFNRLASDGLFGSPVDKSRLAFGGGHPFEPGAPIGGAPAQDPMQAGMPQDQTPLPTGNGALATATGNILGGRIAPSVGSAAAGTSVAQQTAGVLSGLSDQAPLVAYQQRLMDAGINLNPQGQSAGDYQQNLKAAQGIYNNVFGAGLPPNTGGGAFGQPSTSYAPTGLRQQAMAAGGNPVWGQGDVLVSASPNAQGGTGFNLTQASRQFGAPISNTPENPIAPENPFQRMAQAPSGVPVKDTYQQNAGAFKDHIVAQQTQAGLSKGLEPGYMIDPDRPNAVKPIPGSMAEQKLNEAKKGAAEGDQAVQEGARQSLEKANTVTRTINKILPQLNNMTTGITAALTEAIPSTPAYNVGKLRDTVTANIGLKELKSMRDASKTGASGMGQLSEKELDVLQTSLGNLKLGQDTKQVAQAMKDVRNSFYRWRATYKAGAMGDSPEALQRQNAVRWAIAHEKDPRAEQILAMDDN